MPKVQRIRRSASARIHAKELKASASASANDLQDPNPSAAPTSQPTAGTTSLKSKRDARREQWLEKISIRGAAKYRMDQKRQKLQRDGVAADLDSLKFALAETDFEAEANGDDQIGAKSAATKTVSQSARMKKNLNEIARLQKVVNHSAFRANPLETIRTHLKNTLPAQK